MDLRCELSPLVFAVLYQKLGDGMNPRRTDLIEDRLAEIGWEPGWLGEAARAYEAKWQEQLKQATGPTDLTGLPADHAELASWILAALRGTGPSSELGDELHSAVNERALHEITPTPTQAPSHCRPS